MKSFILSFFIFYLLLTQPKPTLYKSTWYLTDGIWKIISMVEWMNMEIVSNKFKKGSSNFSSLTLIF